MRIWYMFSAFVIAGLIPACHSSIIQYDIKVTHILPNNKSLVEEKELSLDQSFVSAEPPSIEIFHDDDDYMGPLVGRNSIDLQEQFERAFGKQQKDEHMNFDLGFGAGLVNSPHWSSWTCCRPKVNIQSRERIVQVPRIEMEYIKCKTNYCPASSCEDDIDVCQDFLRSIGSHLCNPNSMMSTFMSQHCPKTCNFCVGSAIESTQLPATTPGWHFKIHTTPPRTAPWETTRSTRRPWNPYTTTKSSWKPTTRRTRQPWETSTAAPSEHRKITDPRLKKVTVLSHSYDPPFKSYMYSTSDPTPEIEPWQKVGEFDRIKDLTSFYLYKRPMGVYRLPIYFCRSRSLSGYTIFKWAMSKRRCSRGWITQFVLFGSNIRTSESQMMYVGNRGRPHWTTRISTTIPSNGYTSSVFYFYAPKIKSQNQFPFTTTSEPQTKDPIFTPFVTRPTRTTTFTTRPTFTQRTSTRRPFPGQQPEDPYNRDCLEAHNFFRAVHNVPALQWSPVLARTSKSWANELKRIAPEHPNTLLYPGTRNWPHSEAGRGHRNNGDGENIAWDLSGDGSSAKESVLRWYSEIFYYDRNHPTSGTRNRPVGHLTQMLWKDTTHLGCSEAVTDIIKQYSQKSTWSVAHYSPGGNVRYGNSIPKTKELFERMVPDMRRGSCMTNRGSCSDGNQCMAFGPSQGDCACKSGRPICSSKSGCIAWCVNRGRYQWKDECHGQHECKCTRDSGAVCT